MATQRGRTRVPRRWTVCWAHCRARPSSWKGIRAAEISAARTGTGRARQGSIAYGSGSRNREFLRRTGLEEVISRHGAQYLNVTEAWWDRACASEEQVHLALGETTLRHSEVAGFVPSRPDGAARTSVAEFRPLQRANTPWHLKPFRAYSCSLAERLARTQYHALRLGLLRRGPGLCKPFSFVRPGGGF